jgi:hypothetical protein
MYTKCQLLILCETAQKRMLKILMNMAYKLAVEFNSINELIFCAIKLVRLLRNISFCFSISDRLLMLYFAPVKSKLGYAPIARNSDTRGSIWWTITQQTSAPAKTFKTATANKPNKTTRQTRAARGHQNENRWLTHITRSNPRQPHKRNSTALQ